MSRLGGTRPLRGRGRVALVAILGVGLVVLSSCTHDSTPSAGPTATGPTITITKPNAPLQVHVVQASKGVSREQRAALTRTIGAPIKTWVNGAFVAPDYPTSDFSAGFKSWTPKAAAQARRDGRFTTNAALGRSVVAVGVDKQVANLYVFAVHGLTGGATAGVQLRLTEEKQDGSLVHLAVSGRLYLTRTGNTWSIFGYDLKRTETPA
jgi:hypothetical protein